MEKGIVFIPLPSIIKIIKNRSFVRNVRSCSLLFWSQLGGGNVFS